MCAKFHRTKAEGDTHVVTWSDFKVRVLNFGVLYLYALIFFILCVAISHSVIYGMKNANLRTDALLNVTRIASHESINTTLDEDLSNCTTSSMEYCTLINNGTWYIEVENSFYGKLLNYSYFIDNGDTVSCKELRDGDASEDHGLPCAYYAGLSISIGCLLSAASIVIFTWLEPLKVTHFMLIGLFYSWSFFHVQLLSQVHFEDKVKNSSENTVLNTLIYHPTFSSLLHFYLLALVGWMSVFSQRHFLVVKKSRNAVSTCGHVWDVIVRWAPYCAYFPAFFIINWLLSYVIPFFPYDMMPACDESCWLRQNTLLFSFTAPVAVFALLNVNGGVMLKYHEQYLEDPRLKEDFVILSKLFYGMLIIWAFGVLLNCVECLYMFRLLFNIMSVCEGLVCVLVVFYSNSYWSSKLRDFSVQGRVAPV